MTDNDKSQGYFYSQNKYCFNQTAEFLGSNIFIKISLYYI